MSKLHFRLVYCCLRTATQLKFFHCRFYSRQLDSPADSLPTEDFFEVAAARIAELSTEVEEEAAATYAEDTPTPRLVVIATNADTVSAASDKLEVEEDAADGADGEDDEDQNDVDSPSSEDASRTEAADSGVMLDEGSSTAATTPDESMTNVFSPKKQPGASMTDAILDRKQSLQSSTKSSALVK